MLARRVTANMISAEAGKILNLNYLAIKNYVDLEYIAELTVNQAL